MDIATVKVSKIFKEGMGNKDAGKSFAERKLKQLKSDDAICFVKFYNGYYIGIKKNKRISKFSDKEWKEFVKRMNKEADKS